MKRLLAWTVALAAAPAWAGSGVVGTKHDFSATGPGTIRALTERDACVFCHVPHSGASNRPDPTAVYVPYASSTMRARPGVPTGATRVCLSCHDGTIAVGQTRSGRIATTGSGYVPQGSPSNLGTDLRRTHPVSFPPINDARVHAPAASDEVKLDRGGELQCTACHDPHQERRDPLIGKFLVKSSASSRLCLSCHDAGPGGGGSHATSPAAFSPQQGNAAGWSSVAEAGCAACHVSHGADTAGQLVTRPDQNDDALCLRCHSGAVAAKSIAAEQGKPYAHARTERGVHDAGEGLAGARTALPERSPGTPRHVVCVDCHDPHAASGQRAIAPGVGGPLAGVWGIDQNGGRVEQVRFEYELCFKCHGDSQNKPQSNGPLPPETVRRQAADANLRRVFAVSAASAHPVVAPGRSANVPGLLAPWTVSSIVSCGDCHASDAGPGAGGAGPRGPHGSTYPHLLERSYSTADGTAESVTAYALCYKCHDRQVLLSKDSAFKAPGLAEPRLHVTHLARGAACAACHDAHGISSQTGRPETNAHLVNFDVSVASAQGGVLRYDSRAAGAGSCTLSCHGQAHDPAALTCGTPGEPACGTYGTLAAPARLLRPSGLNLRRR
jgi:predicted CXXCH cytochrome family protein